MSILSPLDYITTAPRIEQEKRGCIRTYTGRYVNPVALRARDICIEDIAHHLSNICRYTGACPKFYSVAQHSVLVCDALLQGHVPWIARMQPSGLAGLLHDAGEAYFNDLASPVKHDPRMKWYRDLEHETTKLIYCVFGLDPALLPLTKPADDAVFKREAATWWGKTAEPITAWTPQYAEMMFLRRFAKLKVTQ